MNGTTKKAKELSRRIDSIETGERIKALRNKFGLTQEEFANKIKFSRAHCNRIENGNTTVKDDFLEAIKDAFNCKLSDIIVYEKDYNAGFYEGTVETNKLIDSFYYCVYGMQRKLFKLESSYLIHLIVQSLGFDIVPEADYEILERECPDSVTQNIYVKNHDDWFSKEDIEEMEMMHKKDVIQFRLLKNNKEICIWKADEFYKLEEYLKHSVIGIIENGIFRTHACDPASRNNAIYSLFASNDKHFDTERKIKILKRELMKLEKLYERRGHDAKSQRNGDDL